jgi:hypothetical protein
MKRFQGGETGFPRGADDSSHCRSSETIDSFIDPTESGMLFSGCIVFVDKNNYEFLLRELIYY